MCCTVKLSRDKRGAGSIIGAVFILLILMTGFTYYFLDVNVTEDYNKILQDMGELELKRNKENIEFTSVSITADDKLNMTVKNTGSYNVHLIWLGVFNKTSTPETQQYSSLSTYVAPADTATEIGSTITVTPGSQYVIQLMTELGNVFNYDLYPITLTGPDAIPYYQTPADWRSYTVTIPSATGTSVPTYFSIYTNGSSVEFSGISNPDWVHTDANGEYTVTIKSKNVAGETFILYVTAGSLVGQKRITQEPK
jgi:archaellum component FlaG (FlaF/FlaG flagellin family)